MLLVMSSVNPFVLTKISLELDRIEFSPIIENSTLKWPPEINSNNLFTFRPFIVPNETSPNLFKGCM